MAMMIREMDREDRPRERFALSPGMASMADLVAILLRTGCKGCSVVELARIVTERLGEGGLSWHEDLDWRDLQDIPGIDRKSVV